MIYTIVIQKFDGIPRRNPYQIKFPLSADVLKPTPSLAKRNRRPESQSNVTTIPLSPEELPEGREGYLVALDSEFVTLNAVRFTNVTETRCEYVEE